MLITTVAGYILILSYIVENKAWPFMWADDSFQIPNISKDTRETINEYTREMPQTRSTALPKHQKEGEIRNKVRPNKRLVLISLK